MWAFERGEALLRSESLPFVLEAKAFYEDYMQKFCTPFLPDR